MRIFIIALTIPAVWAMLVAVSTPSGRHYLAKLDRDKRPLKDNPQSNSERKPT